MTQHADFASALDALRTDGGAMNYFGPSSLGPSAWQTGTVEEIEEATDMDAYECTVRALAVGGLDEYQIWDELHEWVNYTAEDDVVKEDIHATSFEDAVEMARESWEGATTGTYEVMVCEVRDGKVARQTEITVTAS